MTYQSTLASPCAGAPDPTQGGRVIEDHLYLGRYVTPSEAKRLPVYNWFVYPHSFSPTLVHLLIDRFGLTGGDRIFDPFVGAGTTLLRAKESDISAVGLDMLPISAALTNAKVVHYDTVALKGDIARLTEALENADSTPSEDDPLLSMARTPETIVARAFDEATLRQIVRIKGDIARSASSSDNHAFLLVGLLAILEAFSLTRKSGGWLKIVGKKPGTGATNIMRAYLDRVTRMAADVVASQVTKHHGEWVVKVGDARDPHPDLGQFDAVISSPPYLNRHDYTRVLALELLVGFLGARDDLKNLRYNLLCSHPEAKLRPVSPGYIAPEGLATILAELRGRKADPRVVRIVEAYFQDMYAVLRALGGTTTKGGHVAFVLGNVRFSGVSIPVDEMVAEVGEAAGLEWEATLVARRRNNSAQQMRAYGRDPSREGVIIWRAP